MDSNISSTFRILDTSRIHQGDMLKDFELSKYHPDENAEIGVGGTSTYWSPEIKQLILDKYRDGKNVKNEINALYFIADDKYNKYNQYSKHYNNHT